jgi:hypothetical protein
VRERERHEVEQREEENMREFQSGAANREEVAEMNQQASMPIGHVPMTEPACVALAVSVSSSGPGAASEQAALARPNQEL